jgi:hypothetical protein
MGKIHHARVKAKASPYLRGMLPDTRAAPSEAAALATVQTAIERAPAPVKLVTGLFLPHLERLPMDCGRCGFLGFKIVVSPLLGEHKGAAVIQYLECVRCKARVNVLDGCVHGRRPNAHKPPRRVS